MSSSDYQEKTYQASWLVQLFHSFPRLDLTFVPVNSTFSPGDQRYRESLIIWAAVPVLWLVLTLLVFLMYFCYRCCQRDVEKKQRVPCLRWTMAIMALLTCAVIGLGFYGNEEIKKGVDQFADAAHDAEFTTDRMKLEVSMLQKSLNDTVNQGIKSMQQIFESHPELSDDNKGNLERLTQKSLQNARGIMHNARNIQNRASKVKMGKTVYYTREIGFYLWLGTLVMLGCFILLALNLLLGIGRSSKCILLLFCALGIISLVICWIAAGIFFGSAVGVSDFCMEPNVYFEQLMIVESNHNYRIGDFNGVQASTMERDVIRYYITCNTTQVVNPFRIMLQEAQESVRAANNTINKALGVANKIKAELTTLPKQVSQGLDGSVETIMHLTALVECTGLHKDYNAAVEGVCDVALPGGAFLLLSTVLTGLLLTLLVLMASRAWRHFTRRKGYQEVDEDDPFLPRPDPNSPSYYSFTRQGPRGNPRAAGEQITMQRRNTPPPAYNSYGYNHSNASPSPDENHIPDFGSDSQA